MMQFQGSRVGWICLPLFLVALLSLGIGEFGFSSTDAQATFPSPIEELISPCPSAEEIVAIDAKLSLRFEGDPTAGSFVCTEEAGSRNLTLLQERTYQALIAMQKIPFSEPFPWTNLALFDWLTSAIEGMRFRTDINNSFCCDPTGFINVRADRLAVLDTRLWSDPSMGVGLDGFMVLMAHEARHNEGYGHPCQGTKDNTIDELGAWGVQYYLHIWQALYTGSFLDSPDSYADHYRSGSFFAASDIRSRFCQLPKADLSITANSNPSVAATGSELDYQIQATNLGPTKASDVFVYLDSIPGTAFVSATSSMEGCSFPPVGKLGVIGCHYESLKSGQKATIHIIASITAEAGSNIGISAGVVGSVADSNKDNDTDWASIKVQ